MQPLSYQIGNSTCWITSIINGITFLSEGERISSFQYKALHAALNSILWKTGVWYWEDGEDYSAFEHVLEMLESTFRLQFNHYQGGDVADGIRNLRFGKQVAVCDVGNGDHSILLNGISECGEWLLAFDPWWYGDGLDSNDNVEFPDENGGRHVHNVRIRREHLLNDPFRGNEAAYSGGQAYPMGKNTDKRFLTVLEVIRTE